MDWQWIDARALRGGLALTTDWQLIGGRLVLVLRRIDLDAPWIGEISPIQNGLSIGIGFVLDWHCIGIALAVIANLRQSSPICQSGGNPLIPRNYKQSRLTWIGVIGGGKSGVLYIDWQCIGIELAVDRPLGKI